MITHIKLVGIYVHDQERALDFYANKLGFEVLANEPYGEDARWIEVAPPGAQTRLALSRPPAGMESRVGTSSQIIFTCENVRATYEEMRSRGVTFTQEPDEQPWELTLSSSTLTATPSCSPHHEKGDEPQMHADKHR